MATLRRATPEDAADLTRLRGFMHEAMGDALTPEWRLASTEVFARRLARADFAAFVVEQDGQIVSGGAGWIEEHLSSPYALDPRRGHVASMSTDPRFRRRGHGRLVFEALMAWFDSHDLPRVDLRATEDGRPLYESFGFRVLGGATMAWLRSGTRAGMR